MGKKSPAQLDREIASNVPAWQRGLDMTKSRELERTLKVSPAEFAEIERRKSAANNPPLAVRLDPHEGPSRTSNRPRSVTVRFHPGVAHRNQHRVVNAIRAARIDIEQIGPGYVTIEVPRGDDLVAAAGRVAGALAERGITAS